MPFVLVTFIAWWKLPKLKVLISCWITSQSMTNLVAAESTAICIYILLYSSVGLHGSSLFNFGSYVNLPTLFTYILGFDIPTSSIFIANVFIILIALDNNINLRKKFWKLWKKNDNTFQKPYIIIKTKLIH